MVLSGYDNYIFPLTAGSGSGGEEEKKYMHFVSLGSSITGVMCKVTFLIINQNASLINTLPLLKEAIVPGNPYAVVGGQIATSDNVVCQNVRSVWYIQSTQTFRAYAYGTYYRPSDNTLGVYNTVVVTEIQHNTSVDDVVYEI